MPGTRRAALIWGTLVSLAVAGQALAQTPPTPSAPPPPVTMVAPVQPVLVTPSVEFGFAPRFWYLFKDQAGVKAQNPLILNQGGDVQIPMGGGVGTARFLSMPDTTFSLSVLFGNVTATSSRLCAAPGTGPSPCDPKGQFNLSSTDAHSNVDRLDLEILAQTQIPNTPWGWIVGGRWEHQTSNDRSKTTTFASRDLIPGLDFPNQDGAKTVPAGTPVSLQTTGNGEINTITGKLGVAAAIPINEAGTMRVFGNGLILAGLVLQDSRNLRTTTAQQTSPLPNVSSTYGIIGPEAAVGLQYVISPSMVADFRYRAMYSFLFATPTGIGRSYIDHGPMASLNIKF